MRPLYIPCLGKKAFFGEKIWMITNNRLHLHQQKITGLQNTASDCSSGGKGSEVLIFFYIRNVV